VTWADTDASGAWMFTAVLRYVEEAEVELLRAAGVVRDVYGRLPRVYAEARFLHPAFFDEEVEVVLGLTDIGTSSLHYRFEVHCKDELAAHGRMGSAFVEPGVGRGVKAPLPESVRSALAPYMGDAHGQAGTGFVVDR
jgi:acyl-CoA thioesterase FadM